MLIFAIDDKQSFQFAQDKYEIIKKKKVPFILVGNKSDLQQEREKGGVSYQEASHQAKIWGVNYMETSAKVEPVRINQLLFSRDKMLKLVF